MKPDSDQSTGSFAALDAGRTALRARPARAASSIKRMQQLLREQEELLREHRQTLAEAERMAHFGNWSFDLVEDRIEASDEAFRLFGLEPPKPGEPPLDYRTHLYSEDRARMKALIRAAIETAKSVDTHLRVVRDDGGIRWLRVVCRPLDEQDGPPRRLLGLVFDITPLKRIEMQQRVELMVSRLLAGSDSFPNVVGKIIRNICRTLGWEWGAYWELDRDNVHLRCMKSWRANARALAGFAAASQSLRVTRGVGLIGEVFACGKPRWINDVSVNTRFLRREAAQAAGLRGGFAFPVLANDRIVGVLEFFSRFPRHPDASLPAISRTLGAQIGQFMQRKLSEERIHRLANYDELTGLYNRNQFGQALRHALMQARRHGWRIGLLFIDLDRFKSINDTLGHEAGDEVLREFARRLRRCFRESDTVARLGGDEFVVLIEDAGGEEDLENLAHKVIHTANVPFKYRGHEYHLGASIGLSMYPKDDTDAATLLKNADVAMYRAKSHGKNRFEFYSAQMNAHSLARLALQSNLAQALARDQLSLHYQPIYNLVAQQTIGFEALLRWRHPDLGDVSPDRFIPLAEETGLIHSLGAFVLNRACAEAARWPHPLGIAVNVSSRQLNDNSFVRLVQQTLDATGLDARRLKLEITESAVMQPQAIALLEQVHRLGVRLALDDFGTGYSSLAYLKRLPLEDIKLDQIFVRGLPRDPDDAAIARSVIALGHNLKLSTIAEGVERDDQLGYLTQYGCDAIQGELVSRPLPAAEAMNWLEMWRQKTGQRNDQTGHVVQNNPRAR